MFKQKLYLFVFGLELDIVFVCTYANVVCASQQNTTQTAESNFACKASWDFHLTFEQASTQGFTLPAVTAQKVTVIQGQASPSRERPKSDKE
jgi:hypothetical protein